MEIPRYLSEGQMLRMRRVAIKISYPDQMDWKWRQGHIRAMKVEIPAIFAALRKSNCLEHVRVILHRQDNRNFWGEIEQDFLHDQHMPMRNLLRPLIDMAHERGIKIEAEHNSEHVKGTVYNGDPYDKTGWTDPLVIWFNNAAILPEMKANFAICYYQGTEKLMEKSLGHCKNLEMLYKLSPECRNCLQVFGKWEELATRLEKKPKHRMHFRYKKWNELNRFAELHGPRKCPTCAKAFVGIAPLEDPMEGHKRSYIVPRYPCDNKEWEKQA